MSDQGISSPESSSWLSAISSTLRLLDAGKGSSNDASFVGSLLGDPCLEPSCTGDFEIGASGLGDLDGDGGTDDSTEDNGEEASASFIGSS